MYLVISPSGLLLQRYNKLIVQNINARRFLYQQSYQHTNSLILLFLQNKKFKME